MRNFIDNINSLFESKIFEAKRTTGANFIQMARTTMPNKVHNLTLTDLNEIARLNDTMVPNEIRFNTDLKTDPHHWNLSDGANSPDSEKDKEALSKALGAPVDDKPVDVDPEFQDALILAKAKTVSKLAKSNKVWLMGRNSKTNRFFCIPGLEEYSAQMERMLANSLKNVGDNNMETQYADLVEKIKLIAGNQSAFLKSLLIVGAPSSGKSFILLKTLKELGLTKGQDYIFKKGRISAPQLFRALIVNIDGLIVFDDCDSVVESTNGVNMLKGALDTDPIRQVSNEIKGAISTSTMSDEDRDEYVNRLSKVLRHEATLEDYLFFEPFAVRYGKVKRTMTMAEVESSKFNIFSDDDDVIVSESKKYISEAKRVKANKFINAAQKLFGGKSNFLSINDLQQVADENDWLIPTVIKTNPEYKIGSKHWDLSDKVEDDKDDDNDDDDENVNKRKYGNVEDVLGFVSRRLPDTIDFRGRIIFVSNMLEAEWPSAILSRAFFVNLEFTSSEMLDYIDKVKSNINVPKLNEEQKQEVMDYIRKLWITGKLKHSVNFRLVLTAFDLRLSNNWQRLLNQL